MMSVECDSFPQGSVSNVAQDSVPQRQRVQRQRVPRQHVPGQRALAVGSLILLLARSCCSDTKRVVIYVPPVHHCQGLKQGDISQKLQQEGIKATG